MNVHVTSILLSVSLAALCVAVHYEALVQLEKMRRALRRHRPMIMLTVLGLLLAHVIEIWIFGAGYYVAEHWLDMGRILVHQDGFDYIYYSAMVYTTVGFGDLVPTGSLRMITSTEALTGLSMITWSASFTFLQMQRMWRS